MCISNPDCLPFTTVRFEASCDRGCLKAFERCFGCGTLPLDGGLADIKPRGLFDYSGFALIYR
jgi:hypothetical protein